MVSIDAKPQTGNHSHSMYVRIQSYHDVLEPVVVGGSDEGSVSAAVHSNLQIYLCSSQHFDEETKLLLLRCIANELKHLSLVSRYEWEYISYTKWSVGIEKILADWLVFQILL